MCLKQIVFISEHNSIMVTVISARFIIPITSTLSTNSIVVFERIAAEGAISDADLRLLVEQIEISKKNGKLDVYVTLNRDFRQRYEKTFLGALI